MKKEKKDTDINNDFDEVSVILTYSSIFIVILGLYFFFVR